MYNIKAERPEHQQQASSLAEPVIPPKSNNLKLTFTSSPEDKAKQNAIQKTEAIEKPIQEEHLDKIAEPESESITEGQPYVQEENSDENNTSIGNDGYTTDNEDSLEKE